MTWQPSVPSDPSDAADLLRMLAWGERSYRLSGQEPRPFVAEMAHAIVEAHPKLSASSGKESGRKRQSGSAGRLGPSPSEVMTSKAAAQALGIAPRTLRAWRAFGRLPATPGLPRGKVLRADVEQLIASGGEVGAAPAPCDASASPRRAS